MKKPQRTVSLEPKLEDAVQTLRINTAKNIELTYNQVINMLVKEALEARGSI